MPSLPKPRLRRGARSRSSPPPPDQQRERTPNVETIDGEGLRWVNIERPSQLEMAWLEEHFEFHPLDLEDVLSRNQRPKIDEYDSTTSSSSCTSRSSTASVGRLNAGELDIFVGRDFLVTIPNQPLQPVEYLFERCRSKEELREQHFSKGSGYLLYRIVDDSFDYCFPMLRKIGNKLDAVEDEIFEGRSEEVVRDISNVEAGDHQLPQGDPAAAHRAARPRELQAGASWRPTEGELEVYFDDIVDAHERIWDMLENYKEVVEAPRGHKRVRALPPGQRHPARS